MWEINVDHCHMTRKYRGAEHVACDLKTRQSFSSFSPIAFHNPSKYAAHFFFTELMKQKKENCNFSFILKSNEKKTQSLTVV